MATPLYLASLPTRKWWRVILIVLFCLPEALLGWIVGGLSLALFMSKKPRVDPEMPFVLIVTWRDWWGKIWKYSTTISFFIGMHPKSEASQKTDDDPTGEFGRTRKHERVHVRQIIDRALLSVTLALIILPVDPWLAFGIRFGGPLYQLPNFLGVLLRGDGNIYRDAQHERSAYAQTDIHSGSGDAWLDRHLAKPRVW